MLADYGVSLPFFAILLSVPTIISHTWHDRLSLDGAINTAQPSNLFGTSESIPD